MNNIENKDEKTCIGCECCVQICPQKCISMEKNSRGFYVPKVDKEKCINCGLCKKKCPYENDVKKSNIQKSYAAISNDINLIKTSTSGGIFLQFGKEIISEKGIVFGCAWNSENQANHIQVDNEKDLIKLSQSKYVQSNLENTFIDAQKYLNDGRKVLYSGTACQLAGLISFLGKEYDNLYTVEVACHGVPSPGLFENYLKWFEKKENKKIKQFSFRNKAKHKTGEHYMFCVEYTDGSKKYYYANEDPYYASFLNAKILRKTCYECKYKGKNRISDITLCDYWGIDREHKKFPAQNGVSAVMINSIKGEKLFNKVKNNLTYIETTFESISKHNKSLINSASTEKMIEYDINDENLFNELKPNITLKGKLKNMIPGQLKYYLKRIR